MLDPSDHFVRMAERITRNWSDDFGGAMLVVPPGGGDPIEILLIDPTKDLARFWAAVQGAVTVAAREFEERARTNDPFRR